MSDLLLENFQALELPEKQLNAIYGGEKEIAWTSLVITPTGRYFYVTYDDGSTELKDRFARTVDFEKTTAAGDVG